MLISVPEEQIYHIQHLTIDVGYHMLEFSITDRHFPKKTDSYTRNVGKVRVRINVLFKIFQFLL